MITLACKSHRFARKLFTLSLHSTPSIAENDGLTTMVRHFLLIALLQNDCCNRCRLGPTSLTGFGAFGTCLSPDLWATAADDFDPGLEDAAEAFFNAFWSAYTAGHLGLTDTCTHNIILSCIRQKMKVLAAPATWK